MDKNKIDFFGTCKMRRFINNKKKEEQIKNVPLDEKPIIDDIPIDETVKINSIQEFIELKKLQNRVLEKMLEKMNQSENKENN